MKQISIKKLSSKLRDAIIKEIPDAISVNFKGEVVTPKEPKWFTSFRLKQEELWARQEKINNSEPVWFKEFREDNEKRWARQEELWARQEKINNSEPVWFKKFREDNDKRWDSLFENNPNLKR